MTSPSSSAEHHTPAERPDQLRVKALAREAGALPREERSAYLARECRDAAERAAEEHKDTLGCVQGIVDLYAAWDQADPGKGYVAKAAEWRGKIAPASADSSGTPGPNTK